MSLLTLLDSEPYGYPKLNSSKCLLQYFSIPHSLCVLLNKIMPTTYFSYCCFYYKNMQCKDLETEVKKKEKKIQIIFYPFVPGKPMSISCSCTIYLKSDHTFHLIFHIKHICTNTNSTKYTTCGLKPYIIHTCTFEEYIWLVEYSGGRVPN
jgi:hypothetical protein